MRENRVLVLHKHVDYEPGEFLGCFDKETFSVEKLAVALGKVGLILSPAEIEELHEKQAFYLGWGSVFLEETEVL